jgi:hypothetical protein
MRTFLISLALLLSLSAVSQSLEFFREDLVFTLDSNFFTVSGDYYFRNPGEQAGTFSIVYPVPYNGPGKSVDTIVVMDDESHNQFIPVTVHDTLCMFQVQVSAKGIKRLTISYRQKHKDNQACYILTTTRQWGKPLEQASYELVMPAYLEILESSYPPDSHSDFGDAVIFHWRKTDFMPDKDFLFRFSPAGR